MEFRPSLDPVLLVRARSEADGIEVDWYQRVGPDTMTEVLDIVGRYLDHRPEPPQPRGSTWPGELRYLELVVGDTGRQLVMREPSAGEREQGIGVRPPEPAAHDVLPTPLAVQQLDFGSRCPNVDVGTGPPVSWSELVAAIRFEIDRRR